MTDIAFFLMDLDGGGAEKVMLNLAGGFAEQGLDVDLVLVKAEGPYILQISPRVRTVKLEGHRLLMSLPALIRYLQRERPVVLISALEDTNMVALWAKRLAGVSTQVVVTVHAHISRGLQNATRLKHKLIPYFVPWFYPWADEIIAVSQGVAEDLAHISGLPLAKIKVIYNPVVTPEFLAKIDEPFNHVWFLENQPPVILGVGRLEKQKDFPTLIRAFARVRQQYPTRLMILGEGKERPYLEALVQELGLAKDVIFPGFVANPYVYMARAAILVLSSAWEGFGNVLAEAMAVGVPVVSTNCESGPAEILENGHYGKLVAVGDIHGMAEAITTTLKHPPNSETLRRRAMEFSLDKASAQYRQLLRLG